MVLSRTLPETDGCVASKEHVEKVLDFMSDFKPKPHPHHHMPRWTKLLIHRILDHLSSSLKGEVCVHMCVCVCMFRQYNNIVLILQPVPHA